MSDQHQDQKQAEPTERESKLAAVISRNHAERMAIAAGCGDAESVKKVAAKILENLKTNIDESGSVKTKLVDEDGNELRINEAQLIDELKTNLPDLFSAPSKKAKPAAPGSITQETNPWIDGNITRQGWYLKNQPEMAARFQRAARETEAARRASNPFTREGLNLTAQAKLLRENPDLARKLQTEAAGPEPNPFKRGREFNLTAQCLLLRRDPEKARRLKAEAEKGGAE